MLFHSYCVKKVIEICNLLHNYITGVKTFTYFQAETREMNKIGKRSRNVEIKIGNLIMSVDSCQLSGALTGWRFGMQRQPINNGNALAQNRFCHALRHKPRDVLE